MNSIKTSRLSPQTPSSRPLAPTRDQIAALAHAIWIDRGCPVGRDVDHWLEAERQLGGGAAPTLSSRLPGPDTELDPERSSAARIDRALDRVVPSADRRSPTAL